MRPCPGHVPTSLPSFPSPADAPAQRARLVNAIVWYGAGDLRYETVPDPVAGAGEVVVDIALSGVCGSDLHPIRGHNGPRRPPLILGHELLGSVTGRPGRF